MKDTIITLIIASMAVVIIAQHCAIKAPSSPVCDQMTEKAIDIPSIRQIQQMLNDTGKKRYDCGKVDGKISLTGKTQKSWNNYTKDQFAKVEFEGDR